MNTESPTAKDELYQKVKISFSKHDIDNSGFLDRKEMHTLILEEFDQNLSFMDSNLIFDACDFDHKDDKIDIHELHTTMKYLNSSVSAGNGNFLSQLTGALSQFKQESSSLLKNTVEKLSPYHNLLNIKDKNGRYYPNLKTIDDHHEEGKDSIEVDPGFESVFSPVQMRCIALVSHNNMKATMKSFVIANKNVLTNFRLTGTKSTMIMLQHVFQDVPDVVFGASCESGPLGGDAQLVAQICSGSIGGIIFFQDPMESHAHNADIECLNRQALIHNVMITHNPTSALMMMTVLRTALREGKADLIPSFFFSLESPSVYRYKHNQEGVIQQLVAGGTIHPPGNETNLDSPVIAARKIHPSGDETHLDNTRDHSGPVPQVKRVSACNQIYTKVRHLRNQICTKVRNRRTKMSPVIESQRTHA